MSNFSVKTANRALMTGYRDGGVSSARRKSSVSSQGHQSPPFLAFKDDYDVIGTVPGFEKLVEAESLKQGRLKVIEETSLWEETEYKDRRPAKRKKTGKEDKVTEIPVAKQPSTNIKSFRKSVEPFSGTGHVAIVGSTPPSPPSTAIPSSGTTAKTGVSRNQVKRMQARSSGKTPRPTTGFRPQISLSRVRIESKTEFNSAGMTVQFGTDRIALTIKRNCTKIPYSQLRLVEYYTASTVKVIRLVIRGKLAGSSILAPYFSPTAQSGKLTRTMLFTNARTSLLMDICEDLKQKGIETKELTPNVAEQSLANDNKRTQTKRTSDRADKTLFVFPLGKSTKTKSIAVRAEDTLRLNDGEFLNDTLIEFGLKFIHTKLGQENAALARQVYIFNTFFYQRMIAKPTKNTLSSYEAIKSWTAKVDLFSMKYLIIPIHDNLHWYLAIICNPGLLLKCGRPADSNQAEAVKLMEITSGPNNGDHSSTAGLDKGSPPGGSRVGSISKETPQPGHVSSEEKPYILCLDSLGGSHPAMFKMLRSFLQQELLSRKGIDVTLTTDNVPGKHSSKCPQQENLWDCGIYLLHYTEVFLKNPSELSDAIVNGADNKTMWASSELPNKREAYKDIVASLTEEYNAHQIKLDLIKDFKDKGKERAVCSEPQNMDEVVPGHDRTGTDAVDGGLKEEAEKSGSNPMDSDTDMRK
ncbi:hypothetical protein BG011_005339 [Mortierella polycephala]|uniref:Ubiquitin-like protease family profile domain-containing protein n=1 Tax=Mortierella polycephala TaxID=41804 RepID=A0A9P6U0F8_9FUNG|nr:hypothetical protein BG011_005339 [Mortierella polycephala]